MGGLCIAALACDNPDPPPAHTIADSSGVEVVRSSRPAVADSVAFELGSVILDLSEKGHAFDGVRDVIRMDSTYVVAEQTRVSGFSLEGDLLWEFGRQGDGPMEFHRISDLEPRADSLAVFDYWRGRVAILDKRGGWVRGFGLGVELLAGDLVPIDEEKFAVHTTLPSALAADAPLGLLRSPGVILAFDWDGHLRDSVARVLGPESVRLQTPDGVADQRPIFGHSSHIGAKMGRIVRGDGERLGFDELRTDGSVARTVSADVDLSLDSELLEAEWRVRSELLGPEGTRRLRETTPIPARRPAYADLKVSPDGSVWLREHFGEYQNLRGLGPQVWQVFSQHGSWLGRAEIPIDFTILEVGEASILGVYRDGLDVERPQVRALEPEPPSPRAPIVGESDSAGVRILAIQGPLSAAPAIGVTPVSTHGLAPGEYTFQHIVSAALMPDGSAVVADRGSDEVLTVSPDGGFEVVLRSGQGPSEVRAPIAVRALDDESFWVDDDGNARLVLASRDGVLRSVSTGGRYDLSIALRLRGLDDAGKLLMSTSSFRPEFEGRWRMADLVTLDPSDLSVDSTAQYRMAEATSGTGWDPFQPYGTSTVVGGTWAVGWGGTPEVRLLGERGTVRAIVRWEEELRYPDEDWVDRFKAYLEADYRRANPGRSESDLQPGIDRQIAALDVDFGRPLPELREIFGDDQGRVWVEAYEVGTAPSQNYTIIRPEDGTLRSVAFSSPVTILDIRGDLVLAVVANDLDVQALAWYRVDPLPVGGG